MWEQIGKAEVEVRVRPLKHAELREYLVREYGPGTEPGFLFRQAAEGVGRPRQWLRNALKRVVRALVKAMGAWPANNGRRPGGGSAQTVG